MMKRIHVGPWIICLLLGGIGSGGCVSQSHYNELESLYNQQQGKMDEVRERERRAKARAEKVASLYKDLQSLVEMGLIEVHIMDGRMVISLPSDVLFASGSAELTDVGARHIKRVVKVLARRTDENFQVAGHTDSDPINTIQFPTNWHLGSSRAINVTMAMISSGMPSHRISAATYGDTKPVKKNTDNEGKAKNRRIELILLPDLTFLPGYRMITEEYNKRRQGKKAGKKVK